MDETDPECDQFTTNASTFRRFNIIAEHDCDLAYRSGKVQYSRKMSPGYKLKTLAHNRERQ